MVCVSALRVSSQPEVLVFLFLTPMFGLGHHLLRETRLPVLPANPVFHLQTAGRKIKRIGLGWH